MVEDTDLVMPSKISTPYRIDLMYKSESRQPSNRCEHIHRRSDRVLRLADAYLPLLPPSWNHHRGFKIREIVLLSSEVPFSSTLPSQTSSNLEHHAPYQFQGRDKASAIVRPYNSLRNMRLRSSLGGQSVAFRNGRRRPASKGLEPALNCYCIPLPTTELHRALYRYKCRLLCTVSCNMTIDPAAMCRSGDPL